MTTDQLNNIEPKRIVENAKPMLIAGLNKKYTFGKDDMNIPAQWEEFGVYLGKIPGQKENVAFGFCFDLDNNKGFKYVCGVEISDDTKASELPGDLELKQLPSFSYAVFEHRGHVSGIRQTCDAIFQQWIPETDYVKPDDADFFYERYGEEFDPQKGIGDVEIWIPMTK